MSELVTTLECHHCGGAAIEAKDGLFTDGDGGSCMSCGMPGHVSTDSESDPYWWDSTDPNDKCADPECVDYAEGNR